MFVERKKEGVRERMKEGRKEGVAVNYKENPLKQILHHCFSLFLSVLHLFSHPFLIQHHPITPNSLFSLFKTAISVQFFSNKHIETHKTPKSRN